ncbi:MAG: Bax inhibitor-1/YccA family protein [Actinobacteria bacterium]|nr:Bax inhibitor-1/YccA family protein [Actinomycetota bacterium]
MASRNPALDDSIFKRETEQAHGSFTPSWGSPADELPPGIFGQGQGQQPGQPASTLPPPPGRGQQGQVPTTAGPVATGDTMRMSGTLSASAILLGIVMVAAVFGWRSVEFVTTYDTVTNGLTETTVATTTAEFPGWALLVMLGSLGVGILTAFKPKLARITGPLYAVGMGLVAGALSAVYNAEFNGIVAQALALTAGVFTMMLFLFATRVVRVTDRMRTMVVAATGAICLVYLVSIGINLIFGSSLPFLHDTGPVGILISLVIVGVASMNLLLDFDFVERGVEMGAPRYMEWYAAFGLMVSLIWLYLEILRLLSKLRSN